MKNYLLAISAIFSLNSLAAPDGIFMPPVEVSDRYVSINEGFRIKDNRIQIVNVALSLDGVESVTNEGAFLSEAPLYLSDEITEEVDRETRTKHFYCITRFAKASAIESGFEVTMMSLKKEVLFTCPWTKDFKKRGGNRLPHVEHIFKLTNLDTTPVFETTTKSTENSRSRGFSEIAPTVRSVSGQLMRITE